MVKVRFANEQGRSKLTVPPVRDPGFRTGPDIRGIKSVSGTVILEPREIRVHGQPRHNRSVQKDVSLDGLP